MPPRICSWLALVVLSLTCSVFRAPADDIARLGRPVFEKHRQAVVTVQIVLKTRMSLGGRSQTSGETRQEATGTVIAPSGLTVLSLAATDPSSLLGNLMAGLGDEESRFKMDSEITDVKILLEDGSDLAAEVVLRDRDLDLVFIRPKAPPARPMPHVDLDQAGTAEVLEPVITITRLGRAGGRAHAASYERISAVVQRPRLFYVPDDTITTTTLGSPAFLLDGRVLGLCVMRSVPGASGGSSLLGMHADRTTAVILPAAEVAKVARQVPAPAPAEAP
ncbi:trypsin-like peptidase domain-containing protein [Limisphaera sp. VF-2]|jgi:hypothetical protein|uniref:trypsin-like peptidase domain-containing protein n=1 Tax=Limisphaera sp. VF-2 TaxID=3400418 RepID=UPI00176164CF